MAEAVVGLVVATLGAALATEAASFGWSLVAKEAAALRDVFGKIRRSKAELESIQAYLHEAERFKDTDRTTSIFVSEIRRLTFQMEDVADEFTYKLEDCKHGGFAGKTRKLPPDAMVCLQHELPQAPCNAATSPAAVTPGADATTATLHRAAPRRAPLAAATAARSSVHRRVASQCHTRAAAVASLSAVLAADATARHGTPKPGRSDANCC